MLEWLKRHAWKACIPQKGISGSNPDLSAEKWPIDIYKPLFIFSVTNNVSFLIHFLQETAINFTQLLHFSLMSL